MGRDMNKDEISLIISAIEPQASAVDVYDAETSIAISLKRIADALERRDPPAYEQFREQRR